MKNIPKTHLNDGSKGLLMLIISGFMFTCVFIITETMSKNKQKLHLNDKEAHLCTTHTHTHQVTVSFKTLNIHAIVRSAAYTMHSNVIEQ